MTLHQIRKFRNINHEIDILEDKARRCGKNEHDENRMDALAATLARHGAYKKFPQRLLDRDAVRRAKRYARRKKSFDGFGIIELDELPF